MAMFADNPLAARIDHAEMRLSESIATTVARLRADARALVRPYAGGLAVFAGNGSPANKAIGVGFDAEFDAVALDALEREWGDRGEPVRFEVSTRAHASIVQGLTARGYRLTGFEDVSGIALTGGWQASAPAGPHFSSAAACSIEELAPDNWRAWMEVVLDGFEAPDGSAPNEERPPRELLEEIFGDIAETPGFRRYLAMVDGVPAGGASLRLDAGVAQLCGAATRPDFRRRGIQSALLGRRLADAAASGCDVAVVTTQPGSKSEANALRSGFSILYTRAVLVQS
jgi:GNAT superfamily N-acetyltransferase